VGTSAASVPGSGCSGLLPRGGCSCCSCCCCRWPPLASGGGGTSSSSEHSGDTASPAHTSDIGSDLARARLLSASLADACKAEQHDDVGITELPTSSSEKDAIWHDAFGSRNQRQHCHHPDADGKHIVYKTTLMEPKQDWILITHIVTDLAHKSGRGFTRGSACAPGPEDSRIWVSCSLFAVSSSDAGSSAVSSLLRAPGRGGLHTGGRLPPPALAVVAAAAVAVAAAARFCREGVREAPAAGGGGCDGVASRTPPSGSSAADLPPWRLKAGEKMDACTPGGGVPSRPPGGSRPAAAAAGRRGGLASLSLELELRLVRRERLGRGAGAGAGADANCSTARRSAWWSAGGTACGLRSWCAPDVAGRAAEAAAADCAAAVAAAPRFGRCRRHMCS
jgi:hypothetical protein